MHESVLRWVKEKVAEHGLAEKSVLEVGSRDINGSVRELFRGPYIGIDVVAGPGVDRVMSAHDLVRDFSGEFFDVVVCTEMLEHDSKFWRSMQQMGRMLKEGGDLLLTTRGNGFPYHGEPTFPDFWRFLPESAPLLAELADCVLVEVKEDPQVPGIFLHAKDRWT